jgi:hypothetical protein
MVAVPNCCVAAAVRLLPLLLCPVCAAACDAAAAAGGGGGKAKEAEEARIDMLDICVGKIVSVQQHPNAGEWGVAGLCGGSVAIAADTLQSHRPHKT